MGWEFAAILGGALVVSLLLGLWQQGRYARSVNELVARHRGADRLLISDVVAGVPRLEITATKAAIEATPDFVPPATN